MPDVNYDDVLADLDQKFDKDTSQMEKYRKDMTLSINENQVPLPDMSGNETGNFQTVPTEINEYYLDDIPLETEERSPLQF